MKKLLFFIIILMSTSGCFKNYYKVNKNDSWNTDNFKTLYESQKKFIIHFTDTTVEMTDPVVSENQVEGSVKKYTPLRASYVNPDTTDKTNPYKFKHRDVLFSEVHIYVNGAYQGDGKALVNAGNFKDMRIYQPNKGASVGSHVLGGFLIILGLAAVTAGAAAVACNCPQVYVETSPRHYEFVAGIYSGAIMSTLERTDQLPLTGFESSSDTIRLLIKGYPGETQFMNQALLKKVEHPKETEIVTDQLGQLYAVKKLEKPFAVTYSNITERGKHVAFRDGETFDFHNADSNSSSSSIVLKYNNDKRLKEALFVARLRNSGWGGYVYHEFIGLYGNAYSTWISRQEQINNKPYEWQKTQGLMMKVQVMTKTGWKTVDYFPAAGNTASRDMAMKIDLSEVDGNNIQIRLESAFRFWELDYAGLSYSHISPSSVKDLVQMKATYNSEDQTAKLLENDDRYLTLGDKDSVSISYVRGETENRSGLTNTYVLVARGYYHQKNKNEQPPQVELLRNFMNPGAFHKYSLEKFNQLGLKTGELNVKP